MPEDVLPMKNEEYGTKEYWYVTPLEKINHPF